MARGGSRRQAAWDTVVARQMWDAGKSPTEIGIKVGVSAQIVTSYAFRHWPDRRLPENAAQRAQVREQAKLIGCARQRARKGNTLPPLKSLSDDENA